jgi:hypothetical protein
VPLLHLLHALERHRHRLTSPPTGCVRLWVADAPPNTRRPPRCDRARGGVGLRELHGRRCRAPWRRSKSGRRRRSPGARGRWRRSGCGRARHRGRDRRRAANHDHTTDLAHGRRRADGDHLPDRRGRRHHCRRSEREHDGESNGSSNQGTTHALDSARRNAGRTGRASSSGPVRGASAIGDDSRDAPVP